MNRSRSAWWLLGGLTLGIACALAMRAEQVPCVQGSTSKGLEDASGINPLTASPAELLFIPGIGQGLARSIHHGIRVEGIESIQEFERLNGIGPARVAAIRESLRSTDQ